MVLFEGLLIVTAASSLAFPVPLLRFETRTKTTAASTTVMATMRITPITGLTASSAWANFWFALLIFGIPAPGTRGNRPLWAFHINLYARASIAGTWNCAGCSNIPSTGWLQASRFRGSIADSIISPREAKVFLRLPCESAGCSKRECGPRGLVYWCGPAAWPLGGLTMRSCGLFEAGQIDSAFLSQGRPLHLVERQEAVLPAQSRRDGHGVDETQLGMPMVDSCRAVKVCTDRKSTRLN